MATMSAADDHSIETEERNWNAATFRNGVLTPIRFAKPKNATELLWRGGATETGPKAFRFTAFWGDDQRYYRAAKKS